MDIPRQLTVRLDADAATTALVYDAHEPRVDATLILAHGAGAGQHSPFMIAFARALSAMGLAIVTFNFLYTERRRRLPDRGPVLEACYHAVIETFRREASGGSALFVGGKSMGGRIATQVAAIDHDSPIAGLVLLGYPLHPPGRPEQRRDAHLSSVGRPMLFVQGSRDAFGTPAELAPVLATLPTPARLHIVERGDHSFKQPKVSDAERAAVYEGVQRTIVEWVVETTGSVAKTGRPRR